MFARANGLTQFSVYQGKWNAAFRDLESELIPMCEDQGMAIVSWASLGGGPLRTMAEQEEAKDDKNARPTSYRLSEKDKIVSGVLEDIAGKMRTSLQAAVSIDRPIEAQLFNVRRTGAGIPLPTIHLRLSHHRCSDRRTC